MHKRIVEHKNGTIPENHATRPDLFQWLQGGDRFAVMAGPCAVEEKPTMMACATSLLQSGAAAFRAGAFKPRTSPRSFQGLGEEGLAILSDVRAQTGLPVVTEVMEPGQAEIVAEYADVLQIGTRNMSNFPLLRAVGRTNRPVILKRGMMSTVEEMVQAAEYITIEGNHRVILCERGIRSFETYTRNTLDLSAVPALKELADFPVIVDPSHGTGRRSMVVPMAIAALAAGADGLLIEVHPDPDNSWTSDGAQTITTDAFETLMDEVKRLLPHFGRSLASINANGSHPITR